MAFPAFRFVQGTVAALTAARMVHALRAARHELLAWRHRAGCIPDPEVRRQALGSIDHKAFHSLGASMFAAAVPARRAAGMVRFCVAYQTLSDFLDNLCDRSRPLDAFMRRALHEAMVVALDPRGPEVPVRLCRRRFDDGGYMAELVGTCQRSAGELVREERTVQLLRPLARLYAQMQSRKHSPPGGRRARMVRWAARIPEGGPLAWWEIAAAAGSTLGVFAVLAADARGCSWRERRQTRSAYFPWISALHILLDYTIDQAEDARTGALNFAACYPKQAAGERRLLWLFRRCLTVSRSLWAPEFHRLVVVGLPALYLTDPKAGPYRDLRRAVEAEDRWAARVRPFIELWRHRRSPAPPQVRPFTLPDRSSGS